MVIFPCGSVALPLISFPVLKKEVISETLAFSPSNLAAARKQTSGPSDRLMPGAAATADSPEEDNEPRNWESAEAAGSSALFVGPSEAASWRPHEDSVRAMANRET